MWVYVRVCVCMWVYVGVCGHMWVSCESCLPCYIPVKGVLKEHCSQTSPWLPKDFASAHKWPSTLLFLLLSPNCATEPPSLTPALYLLRLPSPKASDEMVPYGSLGKILSVTSAFRSTQQPDPGSCVLLTLAPPLLRTDFLCVFSIPHLASTPFLERTLVIGFRGYPDNLRSFSL